MIRELCAQSSGLDVFRQRLIVENRIFLEDSSPSARARANDWLGTMGAAPAGFDPLADREQRRAALREAAAAAAEAATAQGGAR